MELLLGILGMLTLGVVIIGLYDSFVRNCPKDFKNILYMLGLFLFGTALISLKILAIILLLNVFIIAVIGIYMYSYNRFIEAGLT